MSETKLPKEVTDNALQAAVIRGVKLLDKKDPLWWNGKDAAAVIEGMVGHIDLDRLSLSSPWCCVLGQRHESRDFTFACHLIGIEDEGDEAARYGFNLSTDFALKAPASETNERWSYLTELWVSVIRSRRDRRRRKNAFTVTANQNWSKEAAETKAKKLAAKREQ